MIYEQEGKWPAKGDRFIGIMDTPELAQLVVDAVNTLEKVKRDPKDFMLDPG